MESYDIYELMIISPQKKAEMIVREIEKKDKANLNLVRDLITLGTNLDWQDDNDGWTALHYCVSYNHLEIARMLIKAGADVNMQNNVGLTTLHVSAIWNHLEILKMLLDAGVDKTIQDNKGRFPYELAISKGLQELLKYNVCNPTTSTNS